MRYKVLTLFVIRPKIRKEQNGLTKITGLKREKQEPGRKRVSLKREKRETGRKRVSLKREKREMSRQDNLTYRDTIIKTHEGGSIMKRRMAALLLAALLSARSFSADACALLTLPDLSELASDVISGISDAAEDAAETVNNAAAQAGEVLTGAASGAGEMLSGAASQAGQFASDIGSWASESAPVWAEQAGETAEKIREQLEEAGVTIRTTASEIGAATAEKATELIGMTGNNTDDVITAVSDAADLAVDQAGRVVDFAAAGLDFISEAAEGAYQVLEEQGGALMKKAEEAVSELDLTDTAVWDAAKDRIGKVVEEAVLTGILGNNADAETIQVVTDIIFGVLAYGSQYTGGEITLSDYVNHISELIIREGLPVGVGLIVELLPVGRIPNAKTVAKEAAYYLIALAYGAGAGEAESAAESVISAPEDTESLQDD